MKSVTSTYRPPSTAMHPKRPKIFCSPLKKGVKQVLGCSRSTFTYLVPCSFEMAICLHRLDANPSFNLSQPPLRVDIPVKGKSKLNMCDSSLLNIRVIRGCTDVPHETGVFL